MLVSGLETDKYHVLRELGHGGMGVVYLAEDQRLKRQVALKVLYEHLNRDAAFVKRFQEEARSVSSLHHPNIVCVHGLEQANNVVAIDMEYVEGDSLDKLILSAQISPHTAVGIARDVLSGLVTCHDIGIVHRDIKPSNILIHTEGVAKLTDFGLATAYASHVEDSVRGNASSGFYMGTPRYMPTAAWEGGRPQPCWDMYSFGLVFYEMLTGRIVFEGESPMAIVKKHFAEPVPELSHVLDVASPQLVAVLEAMLKATHGGEHEFSSLTALAALEETPECQELRASNSATTLTLPPPRRRKRPTQIATTRRRKTVAGIAAGLVLAFVLVVASRFFRDTEPPPTIPEPVVAPVTEVTTLQTMSNGTLFMEGELVDTLGNFIQGSWCITVNEDGDPDTLIGFTEQGLWFVETSEKKKSSAWLIRGGWARNVSVQRGSIQFGSLTGTLLWKKEHAPISMTMSIECNNSRTNGKTQYNLALWPQGEGFRATDYSYALESSGPLMALLYSQLLPRDLVWPERIEALLPALSPGRLYAPYASTDEITVDGLLNEAIWRAQYFGPSGPIGSLPPQMPPRGATLQVRWDGAQLVLASQLTRSEPNPQFELFVMPVLERSHDQSPRYDVTISEQGIVQRRYFEGNRQLPWQSTWNFDWQCRVAPNEKENTVEILIPLNDMEEIARPTAGKRWRFNAQWTREEADGTRTVVARWGDEQFEQTEHGALIIFEEETP